jgi:hypothetical protein
MFITMSPKNLSKKLSAVARYGGLISCASAGMLLSQTTIVGGKGSANVGTNNGTVLVQNFNMTPGTEKQLQSLSRQYSGSGNGWQGVLFPGSKPTDYGSCTSILKDPSQNPLLSKIDLRKVYVIHLGGSTGICKSLPCSVLAVNGKPVVTLIQSKGSIGIQAEFDVEDGKTIASIDGNVVHVNQHIAWYFKRNDTHTMSVFDQKNREVLWVSLENKNYVRLRATILDSSGNIIVSILDSKIDAKSVPSTADIHGNCSFNLGPPMANFRTVMWNIRINPNGTIGVEAGHRL